MAVILTQFQQALHPKLARELYEPRILRLAQSGAIHKGVAGVAQW